MTFIIIICDITKRRIIPKEISNQTEYSKGNTITADNHESSTSTDDFMKTNI